MVALSSRRAARARTAVRWPRRPAGRGPGQAAAGRSQRASSWSRLDPAVQDREVDLHLVEPGGVVGQVDQAQRRPLALEPADGGLATVGAAVVCHLNTPGPRRKALWS